VKNWFVMFLIAFRSYLAKAEVQLREDDKSTLKKEELSLIEKILAEFRRVVGDC